MRHSDLQTGQEDTGGLRTRHRKKQTTDPDARRSIRAARREDGNKATIVCMCSGRGVEGKDRRIAGLPVIYSLVCIFARVNELLEPVCRV